MSLRLVLWLKKVFVDHIGCKVFLWKGYEPLPPNSPEDTYREEAENYSDTGSVATPLIEHPEGAIVVVQEGPTPPANPDLTNPLDPLLLRVDSSRNIIVEYYPRLPSRPYEELDMEPEQPNQNEEYTTHVHSTEMVDPHQTHVRPIWRTPSGRDLYEKFNLNRPLFIPPHTSVTTRCRCRTIESVF
jgi:hypothetical protein